jgi:hypothetical protein
MKKAFTYTGLHFGTVRINTKQSKKASVYAVMANIGFGAVSIVKNGYRFAVPQEGINQLNGQLKIAVKKAVESPTLQNLQHAFELYGVTVELA